MDDIFDIKFSFEQKVKDKVISIVSTKQGGDYNVFAYHWQCFAWAAIIGFLRNERRPLTPPRADQTFRLKTMMNNDGQKIAQALICMAIARNGSLDIMKNPDDAINLINEYANGGFYHIMNLMESGENTFSDLEKVKREIFARNYDEIEIDNFEEDIESVEDGELEDDTIDDESKRAEEEKPWEEFDMEKLKMFFEHGMEPSSIADRLGKSLYAVKYQLSLLGKIKMPLNVTVKNTDQGGTVVNKSGQVIYTDEAPLKIFNDKIYRFNMKSACMTVKDVKRVDGEWVKGNKMLVAYPESELYSNLSHSNFIDEIEDFVEGDKSEANKIKVKGVWYDYYGDVFGSKRR